MALALLPAALLLVSSLMCLVLPAGAQSSPSSKIRMGSMISATTGNAVWYSTSRRFAFGFYPEGSGFAVGIQFFTSKTTSTVVWTADRDRPPFPASATLIFANNGLRLNLPDGDLIISDVITGYQRLSGAYMLDSGNFVIYDAKSNIRWQTFDYPTDTIVAGQVLPLGKELISSVSADNLSVPIPSSRFRLVNQIDGNAYLYPMNTPNTAPNAYWYFGRNSQAGLSIDNDGALSIAYNRSQEMEVKHFGRIEVDGYFRIFSVNQNLAVSKQYPQEKNKCLIKGVCGYNSYCNSTGDGKVDCLCFPGYVYIDQIRALAGCRRNFTKGSCEASTRTNFITNMSRLVKVTWLDDSYSSSILKSEEECSYECLRDCDCYAALFFLSSNRCSKQRHPFLYGRVLSKREKPALAFLKVVSPERPQQLSAQPSGIRTVGVLGDILIPNMLVTVVFAVAVNAAIFGLCRYRMGSYRRLCDSMVTGLAKAMAPRFLTYKQLEEATDNFSSKNKIGEGSFGEVFKGFLSHPDGEKTPIAVKRLKKLSTGGEKGFRNEMRAIGRLHHCNLVRLLGFCHEGTVCILVYEYMSRGSLADLIFSSEANLNWKERVRIAQDVARGLHYLHEGCQIAIIHSDIKPDNILIGEDGNAKIADMGLAKFLQQEKSTTKTPGRGTLLYRALEWMKQKSVPVSTKVDVYSFGILLLELICLKGYVQHEGVDDKHMRLLSVWAYDCLVKEELESLVPTESVDAQELKDMVKVALWCVQISPERRPTMKDVVVMLGRKKIVEFPPQPFQTDKQLSTAPVLLAVN